MKRQQSCFVCAFSSTNPVWLDGEYYIKWRFQERCNPITGIITCWRWPGSLMRATDRCGIGELDDNMVPDGFIHRDEYNPLTRELS